MTKLGGPGALNPAFLAAAAAADANDYVDFNDRALFHDANRNLTGGVTQLATLTNKPTLTAVDFVVI